MNMTEGETLEKKPKDLDLKQLWKDRFHPNRYALDDRFVFLDGNTVNAVGNKEGQVL